MDGEFISFSTLKLKTYPSGFTASLVTFNKTLTPLLPEIISLQSHSYKVTVLSVSLPIALALVDSTE